MAATVADIMTTVPHTVDVQDPVRRAAEAMREAGTGDVLVCRGDEVVGILTDRDIAVRLVAEGLGADTEVGQVCTTGELVTVAPDTPIEDAVSLMSSEAVRRLPVLQNGRPVGILSLGDLAVLRDPTSALADISAAPTDR